MKIFLTHIILSLIFASPLSHPVHISVTNIDYKIKENKFDISVKLFLDDFEKIINKNEKVHLNLGKRNELSNANFYIQKYISEHLMFSFNHKRFKSKKLILLKKEIKSDENTVWLYLEYKQKKVKDLKIINTLMNDLYRDQKNLLIFTCKNTEKAIKFTFSKTDENFKIN